VDCFSLNPGETRTAMAAAHPYTPGWDFAGVVEKAAADGSSPRKGTRVFGVVAQGSWAEFVVASSGLMADIPAGLSSAQAAALPVAGVTAQACLETAGSLLARKVLITGSAGGLGRYACQLATLAGASVYAISRRRELPGLLQADGVEPIGTFASMAEAKAAGTYDLIVETVGGESLAADYRHCITALMEQLASFFDQDQPTQARAQLCFIADYAQACLGRNALTNSIYRYYQGVVHYFQTRLTNGLLEGINSKIQTLKRIARGFRYKEHCKKMIFFAFGQLKWTG
jgi:NADPH-dependent curcumin reductase CurA